jgi:hypothetical protein
MGRGEWQGWDELSTAVTKQISTEKYRGKNQETGHRVGELLRVPEIRRCKVIEQEMTRRLHSDFKCYFLC